ncbi:Hypothetical protein R9X50_00360700 [Acrodontium crateriforme]|uniref:PH domain-like protein n=1 Tax=Acrodontium crateriforme TaxID=150365 RepID=A0AAQ3M2U4_9PEZI|nr:Hypothetical protein R9X50_00360700 [Acrodontium crateriforme]
MPSKRKTTRPAQAPAQSDYDTDVNLTDQAASLAPPPQRTNTELNLAVLRRYSPDVERIVSIAPFAVVYTFSPETQQWEKCGMEGTLFVCQLNGGKVDALPRYNVMLLNRKSLENFITELFSPEDIEITEEYVILQVIGDDGIPQIFGLWIFSEGDDGQNTRDIVGATIQECAMRAEHNRELMDAQGPVQDEQTFDLDGGAHDQPGQELKQPQAPITGQPVDLLQLFGQKPASQPAPPSFSQAPPVQQPPQQQVYEQPRFTSTSDTEFFRNTSSPAQHQVPENLPTYPSQQPPQANVLLDLFKK